MNDVCFSINSKATFSADQNNDIACVTPINELDDKNITIEYYIPYEFLATASDFENNLMVCDFLAFPGFPKWYDKIANRPIFRTGTISSDPRFDYSYGGMVGGACVAYEAFSYDGSSGSPIFAAQKGPRPGDGISFPGFRELRLIGINAGHLPENDSKPNNQSHSGISYFYKSTAILDLIDGNS